MNFILCLSAIDCVFLVRSTFKPHHFNFRTDETRMKYKIDDADGGTSLTNANFGVVVVIFRRHHIKNSKHSAGTILKP